jgi:Tfp pilus assembly protein PilF
MTSLASPPHRRNRAAAACLAFALIVPSAGCAVSPHTRAKSAAADRWSQVRSKMKLQLAQQQFESGNFTDAAATAAEAVPLDPREAET